MPKQTAIIKTIPIRKYGQIYSFQIKLPYNTERVIGIESSVRVRGEMEHGGFGSDWFPNSFEVPRNGLFGEFRLQSTGNENICYSSQVKEDVTLKFGDYSMMNAWLPRVYTHQRKMEEDSLHINGKSTILQGVYTDQTTQSSYNLFYEVSICVWVEIKEKKNGNDNSTGT